MITTEHDAKLEKPEISYRISRLVASDGVSIQVCKALHIKQSDGLSGASLGTLLAIVKTVTGSTKSIITTDYESAQAARLLNVRRPLARQAFNARPVRQLLEITRWLLTNRHKEDFDVTERLGGWALEQERKEWAESLRENAKEAWDV